MRGDQRPERRGVDERARHGRAEEAAEHEVADEPDGAEAERQEVGAEDLLDPQLAPEARDLARRLAEGGAAGGEHRAVDGAGRRAGHDRERRRAVGERRDLAEPLQHAGLVGAAGAAGREHEAEHDGNGRATRVPAGARRDGRARRDRVTHRDASRAAVVAGSAAELRQTRAAHVPDGEWTPPGISSTPDRMSHGGAGGPPRLLSRNLVAYLAGRFCAGTATMLLRAAILWHVFDLSHSAFQLGLVGIVQFVPALGLMLVGGALADTHDRRRIMMTAQWLWFVAAVVLCGAVYRARVSLPILYATVLLVAVAGAFDSPARAALLPTLVPRELLPRVGDHRDDEPGAGVRDRPGARRRPHREAGIGAVYATYAALVVGSIAGDGLPAVRARRSRRATRRRSRRSARASASCAAGRSSSAAWCSTCSR